jgi:hypothetical protein
MNAHLTEGMQMIGQTASRSGLIANDEVPGRQDDTHPDATLW